jgi:glycosyltransferase involved in cell wall biosynthesis
VSPGFSSAERVRSVLAVGPLPPPIGGDTVSFRKAISSPIWERRGLGLRAVDTSSGGDIRVDREDSAFGKGVRALRILSRFFLHLPRAQVVLLFCNSAFLWALGLPLILISHWSRRKVWVKPFGGSWDDRFDALPSWHRATCRWVFRRADGFLPQTDAFADYLRSAVLDPKTQVVVFPNFVVPEDRAPSSPPEILSRRRFVYLGHIKQEKGVFEILDVLSRRSDLACDFWGPILPRDRERFEERIADVDNATYRGEAEPERVQELLSGYAALLLPTFHEGEGLPGVVLEAFAAARPVIATRWKEIPELVQDGENGLLIEPHSPRELALAMDAMLSSCERWERLGARALACARAYSEEAVLEGILVRAILGVEPEGHFARPRDGRSGA